MVPTEAARRDASLAELRKAEDELEILLSEAAYRHQDWKSFMETQAKWEEFAEQQATERARLEAEGGTLYLSVYAAEKELLTRERTKELRSYFNRMR